MSLRYRTSGTPLAIGFALSFVLHAAAGPWLPGPGAQGATPAAPEPLRVAFATTQPAAPVRSVAPTAPPAPTMPQESAAPAPAAQPEAPSVLATAAPASAAAPAPVPIEPPLYDAAYLDNPPPLYPAMARRMRLQGTVLVRVLVDVRGRAEELRVGQSSGASILDEAALAAVRDWRFVPGRRGTMAVALWVDVPVRFRLQD